MCQNADVQFCRSSCLGAKLGRPAMVFRAGAEGRCVSGSCVLASVVRAMKCVGTRGGRTARKEPLGKV